MKKTLTVLIAVAIALGGSQNPVAAVDLAGYETDNYAAADVGQAYHSALTVTLDDGATYNSLDAVFAATNVGIKTTPPPSQAEEPQYTQIKCSVGSYEFQDRNGKQGVRYNCGGGNIGWYFQLSPSLRSICRNPVTEYGARWFKNGVNQGGNQGHVEPCDYLFHGTFTPVRGKDKISYYDIYTFRVVVNGKTGTARLETGGNYQASNS